MVNQVEIFCGTGGVGKTTISVSRGIDLALKGKKVLLITIDPAKRLKQVLSLDDDNKGLEQRVDLRNFSDSVNEGELYGQLLSPKKTFSRILGQNDNDIISTLTKPYGGMSEISAVLELDHQLKSNKYDHIILDTPPGQHFLDFLNSAKKINSFFDKNFAEIFKYVRNEKKPGRLISKILSSGIDKLLSLLETVTGKGFVNEFIEAIHILYQKRDKFLNAINVEKTLLDPSLSTWYLVSSVDQIKGRDAQGLLMSIKEFRKENTFLIINRSWAEYLDSWNTSDQTLNNFKEKIFSQENNVKQTANSFNISFYEFPEIFDSSPKGQVQSLVKQWDKV